MYTRNNTLHFILLNMEYAEATSLVINSEYHITLRKEFHFSNMLRKLNEVDNYHVYAT